MSFDEQLECKIRDMINGHQPDAYLSFKQVQEEFGCSRSWVYRQHANGHLNIYKLAGKTRVKRSELERLAIAQ